MSVQTSNTGQNTLMNSAFFKEAGLICVTAVLIAVLANHFHPQGIRWIGSWDTRQGTISANAKNDAVSHEREINTLSEAKRIYDAGQAVFVDARRMEAYEAGHVKGAIPFPVGELDQRIEAFFDAYPPDARLVVYCSGRECRDAHELASEFEAMGYTRVRVMVDGFDGWSEKGYPVAYEN